MSFTARLKPCLSERTSTQRRLFFFFLFFFRLGVGFAAGFGGFLHVFGATCASFGALLAFLRLDLLRAQQLDEDFFCAVTTLNRLAVDSQISDFDVDVAMRYGLA